MPRWVSLVLFATRILLQFFQRRELLDKHVLGRPVQLWRFRGQLKCLIQRLELFNPSVLFFDHLVVEFLRVLFLSPTLTIHALLVLICI